MQPISTTATSSSSELSGRLSVAANRLRQQLLQARQQSGHWEGELSASALSTATAISALSFYRSAPEADTAVSSAINQQIDGGMRWLKRQQNSDGGWGDTSLNYSNISTTMLVVASIHAADRTVEFKTEMEAAQAYIDQQGGIDGLRKRYGKDKTFAVPILANCAMAGIVPWSEVAALPFEAACVPQRFYNVMQLPVVSYAIPALVAIGQVKFTHDPPWNPIRRLVRQASIGRSLRVLERMQPASGGYLEAIPLTSFVTMALVKSNRADHPVVRQGVRFLTDSFRIESESEGSWPIDTNLATWNTTLSINALANAPDALDTELASDESTWNQCANWVLDCQNTEVHPFTGAAPGGWGWSDLSGAVPDADDTPGALLAMHHLVATGKFDDLANRRIQNAVEMGLDWLVNLQNRDNGWPTFCRGWGKLPFDRSGTDITAHAIRSLLAWKNELKTSTSKINRFNRAIETGFRYLARNQEKNGSWLPLWFGNQDLPDDVNPCYGTAKVLLAYRDANAFDTNEAKFGLRWLHANQNPDGGWGGGRSVRWSNQQLGSSSVEETALCTEVLLDDDDPLSQQAARRGVQWLITATESGSVTEPWPIGFYFAKLWYFEKLYPLIFASSALNRAEHLLQQPQPGTNL